ncbi:HNH endonuclease [Rhodococcoides trifolii]|uniref:HNH endonuclease n=2 Tax=Rhodococcoides trifolii TaxID=908250 RepID=A0A917FQZ8_9NOCA|nr:HNH endonuclease [Rhodococcus trifolii]
MSSWRVRENAAACRGVESVLDVYETRFVAEANVVPPGMRADLDLASKTASCDIAAATGLSKAAAGRLYAVGEQLDQRLPLTALRFRCGAIDLPRVRAITTVLGKAGDATVDAIEWQALSAAERLTPEPLAARIWALWMNVDPDEARAVREENARTASGVKVADNPDGTATLTGYLSTLEGAQADALIGEMAGTVCRKDPRSKKQLRSAALMAFLRQEAWVSCLCGTADCPYVGRTEPVRGRDYLVQVLVDVETLLGLTASPAHLANGTPLDADLARIIASDARWQGLLTEMMSIARADGLVSAGETKCGAGFDTESGSATDESTKDDCRGDDPGGAREIVEPEPDADKPASTTPACSTGLRDVAVRRFVRRGRIRTGGIVPTPQWAPTTTAGVDAESATCLNRIVAEYLAAVERDPALAAGPHPDGHGGFTTPPAGALNYRPSEQLQAIVRALYPTCTHAGCSVPSSRCELDHAVEFDHDNPPQGGWTISENLHPLCTVHHQVKTARMWTPGIMGGGLVCWRSNSGLTRITAPAGIVLTGRRVERPDPPPATAAPTPPLPTEVENWWDATTWWEKNRPEGDVGPTLLDISHLDDPVERRTALELRAHYRDHEETRWARYIHEPCPF